MMLKTFSLKLFLFFFLSFFLFQKTNAQGQIIKLRNPSFEDEPRPGVPPLFWDDCGRYEFPNETPPDIFPTYDQIFGVDQYPRDGKTYVGIVVRNNESWESFSQKLLFPLLKDSCYVFSIWLSSSNSFISPVRGSDKKVYFTDPIKLRIWGGKNSCHKSELLAESPLINHSEWKEYTFNFSPEKDIKSITFEAFFKTPALFPPNGNILLDNASDIVLLSCDSAIINEKLSEVIPQKIKQQKQPSVPSSSTTSTIPITSTNLSSVYAPSVPFDESTYDWAYHKETLDRMKKFGSSITFKRNELTFNNEKRLITVANEMRKLPYHKLVIDFGGLKTKHAKIRARHILRALGQSNIRSMNYEIRNSKEEDKEVDWLFGKNSFYLGVLLKTNK